MVDNNKMGIDPVLVANPPLPQGTLCPICGLLLRAPVLCENCDVLFCTACVEAYAKDHNGACKMCDVFNKKDLKPASSIVKILGGIKLKCVHKNCTEVTGYLEWEVHITKCECRVVTCKYIGCAKQFMKKEEAEHWKICEYRTEGCPHCKKLFPHNEIAGHSEKCDMKPMECRGCKEEIQLGKLATHIKTCGKIIVSCQRCDAQFVREKQKEHDCVACLKEEIKVLKNEARRQNQILERLEGRTVIMAQCYHFNNTIQEGLDAETFINSGWTVAYDEYYSHPTTNEELDSIVSKYNKKRIVCIAGKKKECNLIKLAAFGTIGKVFVHTNSTTNTRNIGEVFWYFYPGNSFGFSNESNVFLNCADTTEGNKRLSWHLKGTGGYRVGDTIKLNDNKEWKKIILISPEFM
ncbi:MAG: hypothetical protein P4L69_07265 [Desulfosporosinus sp.]|nr:hypothetical protein [Desulfosporosinus sp.]